MQRHCWGPGRTLQAAEGERGGDPAHGQGDIPPPQEASRGRQRRGHVASQPKPPWGSKEGKCFMELEKKKALPTGPGAASSSARPCVSAGTRGWPAPPSLLPAHGGDCRYGGGRAGAVPESRRFAHPGPRGPRLGAAGMRCRDNGSLHPQEHRGKLRQQTPWGWQHRLRPGEGRQQAAQHLPSSTEEAGRRQGPPAPPGRARGSEPGFSP